MIVVKVTNTEITVDGHAGYAEKGKDIVCASVSVLTWNLIRSIQALTSDKIEYNVSDGHVNVKYENLSSRGRLLIDSFFIGISEIEESYGSQYVSIS